MKNQLTNSLTSHAPLSPPNLNTPQPYNRLPDKLDGALCQHILVPGNAAGAQHLLHTIRDIIPMRLQKLRIAVESCSHLTYIVEARPPEQYTDGVFKSLNLHW
jgi:hypothetical protein